MSGWTRQAMRSPWDFLEEAIHEAESEQDDVRLSVGMATVILRLKEERPAKTVRGVTGETNDAISR
jgi:hypothetical protein